MSRADRVAGRLPEKGVDLLLVAHGPNLRYLTGFTGSNGMAVVGEGVRRFVTDFRYVEQAARQVPDFDREQGPRFGDQPRLLDAPDRVDRTMGIGCRLNSRSDHHRSLAAS